LHINPKYKNFWGLLMLAFLVLPIMAHAQEADTTKKELDLERENRQLDIPRQFDRSMGGSMTEMGTYDVPTETKYYKRPFKGQEYLDMAVEAYRKEIRNKMQENWFWHFLEAVSPFINNQFQFGFYNTDVPFVDRDNPLFKSYKDKEKKQ
jgi:hypothetical protein